MRLVSTMLGGGLPSLVSPLLPLLGVDWALDQHNGCIASWFCNKVGLGGILRHGSLCAGFVNVLWSSCPVKGSYHIVKGVSRQTGESCDYGRMVIQRCGLVRFLLPWIWQVLQKLWVVGAIHWKCFCKASCSFDCCRKLARSSSYSTLLIEESENANPLHFSRLSWTELCTWKDMESLARDRSSEFGHS